MDDSSLQQRIKYLVEHGGVWDDPLTDIRRQVRTLYWLVAGTAALHVAVDLLL